MAFETFYDIEELVAVADADLDNRDVVTLDIFDTLFIRRIHDPDEVKRPVCRFIADVAAQQGISTTADRVWETRNAIEDSHRERNGKRHPDHEACYDDFMKEVLDEIFDKAVPDGFLDEVAQFEMRVESAMIVVRAPFAEWLERLRAAGKKVLLVSDIYLPARLIAQLVNDKELGDYVDDVISSADSFKAKASGAAWPLIAERHSLDPSRWLHVGDNPISDGVRPDEFGIRALVLKDIGEKHRKGLARDLAARARGVPLLRGRYLQQLMLPLEEENQEVPELYADGHNFLGPVLGYFCHSVLEYCRRNAIERVYFCSREGWALLQVWESLIPYLAPEGEYPLASYLYVSRIALAKASCARQGLTELGSASALLPANNRDFRDVCRVFSLDLEPLLPFLERHDLSARDPIGPASPGVTPLLRRRFRSLLADDGFQDEVRHQARPAQLKLESYLTQEGFFDQPDVALVDIGWLGTIQHYLVDAISHRLHKPRIHGLLLGATRRMPYRDNHESRLHGLVYDRFRFSFPESLIENVKDLFEEACRAPHPSVVGYERRYDTVHPVLRPEDDADSAAEREQTEAYQPLRQGVFDAAARYAAAMAVTGYRPQHLKPWLNLVLTARLAFPRSAEVERIRHSAHQDDFAGSHAVPRKIRRANRTLWDRPLRRLRFDPLVRIYYYLLHALRLLRN